LEALPSNLTNQDSLKLKALIELKSLKLAEKQKRLRYELVQSISKATTLSTAVDRSAFRRMKRQSLREARQTEKQEKSNRAERDKKERQKHLDYLAHILTHGRELVSFHRTLAGKASRLGSNVVRFHANAAKEEEKRLQRISEERLKALKENDEEAYLKLIDKTKDKRITHLLSQTNQFLETLTNAVTIQKVFFFCQETSFFLKKVY
jgi:ATP-dependent helicase STH1/SNF2